MGSYNSNVERAVLQHLEKGRTPLLERIEKHNRIVLHNFSAAVTKTLTCKLPCCGRRFRVKLIPNQVLYPKYCEDHRTDHRRRHFLDSSSSILRCKPSLWPSSTPSY